MAVDHYENFPVASLLLPRELRSAVRDIYRYARSADDIADEGDAAPPERLDALAEYRRALDAIASDLSGAASLPRPEIFEPLRRTIRRHGLPPSLFLDLLSAFEQDVVKNRYEDDTELLDYCRRSANPVGRLLLHLYGRQADADLALSDAVCTGLQLTNFWQDVALDWEKGRIYLPRRDRERHGITSTR
jgi:squalene synthase HpnC